MTNNNKPYKSKKYHNHVCKNIKFNYNIVVYFVASRMAKRTSIYDPAGTTFIFLTTNSSFTLVLQKLGERTYTVHRGNRKITKALCDCSNQRLKNLVCSSYPA